MHQIIRLSTEQVKTLAELAEKHNDETAHIVQNKNGIVTVEFLFPARYIIALNGRAINNSPA